MINTDSLKHRDIAIDSDVAIAIDSDSDSAIAIAIAIDSDSDSDIAIDSVIDSRVAAAWVVLATVPDPEVPAVSLCDLGIVRDVVQQADHLQIVLTPTYSGCPATEVIAQNVVDALQAAGLGRVVVSHRLAPPWTTDWISAAGREKMLAYGIVPPTGRAVWVEDAVHTGASVTRMHIRPRALNCPRCGSADTERLSAFGSTACKALHRCRACREPFEYFKPL